MTRHPFFQLLTLAIASLFVFSASANAMCNVLSDPDPEFRAKRGRTNRPFAGPMDWIELAPDSCWNGTPNFGEPSWPATTAVAIVRTHTTARNLS